MGLVALITDSMWLSLLDFFLCPHYLGGLCFLHYWFLTPSPLLACIYPCNELVMPTVFFLLRHL